MTVGELLRKQNSALRSSTKSTLETVGKNVGFFIGCEDEELRNLAIDVHQKYAVLLAMGGLTIYIDMMDKYAALLDALERD